MSIQHIKDAILFFDQFGLVRQPRPCGEGILDWKAILSILGQYSPDLNLTLEDHKGLMPIEIYSSEWMAAHPDLTVEELASLVRLARLSEEKIQKGEYWIQNLMKLFLGKIKYSLEWIPV